MMLFEAARLTRRPRRPRTATRRRRATNSRRPSTELAGASRRARRGARTPGWWWRSGPPEVVARPAGGPIPAHPHARQGVPPSGGGSARQAGGAAARGGPRWRLSEVPRRADTRSSRNSGGSSGPTPTTACRPKRSFEARPSRRPHPGQAGASPSRAGRRREEHDVARTVSPPLEPPLSAPPAKKTRTSIELAWTRPSAFLPAHALWEAGQPVVWIGAHGAA